MNRKFNFVRTLNQTNIDNVIRDYVASIQNVGTNIENLKGVELFLNIKRAKVGTGPYPNVSLFEAANRIMSDLVILKSVKYLITSERIPFNEFKVEYGNENNNSHDIMAVNGKLTLVGEAFNVAPSFYQTKKRASIRKLAKISSAADFQLVISNSDCVPESYTPKNEDGTYFLFVNADSEKTRLISNQS